MQHPVGYKLGDDRLLHIESFAAYLLNPWALWQYAHNMAASLVTACLFGLAVPSLLHRWKFDPKIAAGPITLALADFFALALYFTSAWLVLG